MLRLHTYEKKRSEAGVKLPMPIDTKIYHGHCLLHIRLFLVFCCFFLSFWCSVIAFCFFVRGPFWHDTNVCFCQKSTALRKWRIKLCALLGGRKYLRLDFVCFDFISVNRLGFVRVHVRIWLFTIVTICPKLHAMVSLFSILPFLYLFYAFDAVDYLNCQHLWHIHWSFYWFISLI